jgi:hypothetical protein
MAKANSRFERKCLPELASAAFPAAFVNSGQHSIVTAPGDTGLSPRMRNLTLRGSGSTSLLPSPIVAFSYRGFSTLIIAFPFVVHADES